MRTTHSRSTYITYITRSAVFGGRIPGRPAGCGRLSGTIPGRSAELMTAAPKNGAHLPARIPGPAAEVDASPEGPAAGAFFDLDGTLVAGYTAAAQTRDRLRRRDLRVVEFLTIVQLAVQFRLGRRAFETLIEGSALTIKGRLARDVDEMGERIFRQSVADLIYPEMRELVRAHQRRGHTVVLSSSALTNQVAPVARYLGIEYIMCNRLVADEQGMLTGEIEQPVVWGPTKASGVQRFAVDHQVDLRSSYFYADGDEDLSLMCLVGHPRPTNPGPMLTKVAIRRGWPIMRFSSRGSGGPLGVARGWPAPAPSARWPPPRWASGWCGATSAPGSTSSPGSGRGPCSR